MEIYYLILIGEISNKKDDVVKQINILKKYGNVMVEHFNSDLPIDINLFEQADIIIVDWTIPSIEIGRIISKAVLNKKLILCTYFCNPDQNVRLPIIITYSPCIEKLKYSNVCEFETGVRDFMNKFFI